MTRLKVDGMTCNHCRAAVKDALESVVGVKTATVDLEGGFAEVEGSAGAEALIAAVQEEGYQAAVTPD
ncbi:MAG: cation transporter [Trueperaceae bacterium]|nr:MAG: cation transporter [Trueperaceae bacterium]